MKNRFLSAFCRSIETYGLFGAHSVRLFAQKFGQKKLLADSNKSFYRLFGPYDRNSTQILQNRLAHAKMGFCFQGRRLDQLSRY